MALPRVMVAPNGARKGKADHPNLPITLDEIVAEAVACFAAGADGLHLHVRDDGGAHSLDAQRYLEALAALRLAVPNMVLQITTEAVGMYSPAQQRAVVRDVVPDAVSISLAEMCADGEDVALAFYTECAERGISVQHILYGADDLAMMGRFLRAKQIAAKGVQLLFVLGRYAENQQSVPADLDPFVAWLQTNCPIADWAICAFGLQETACLKAAHALGGKLRVGFENSFSNADGSTAQTNAERCAEVSKFSQL